MNPINKLALRTVIITLVIIAVIVGLFFGIRALITKDEPPVTTVKPTAQAVPPADQDQDGLPDSFEASYFTDPTNADTDDDGTADLAEIEAGRNPALKGPDDSIVPPTGEDVPKVGTFTEQYLAALPANTPREKILDQKKLETFVDLHKGQLLPKLAAGVLKTSEVVGRDAVDAYLRSISAAHNKKIIAVTNDDVTAALTARLQQNREPLSTLLVNLEHNIDTLAGTVAPLEVSDLHEQLLAATQALLDNIKLLGDIDKDFVGGLIAAANIDELGAVFEDIAVKIAALEKKYELD